MSQAPIKSEPMGLLTWIEPAVEQLDVRETATQPGTGGDGQRRYPDCTRS